MTPISPSEMDQLQDLAHLEYQVAQRLISQTDALDQARQLGIPEVLLDGLQRVPGQTGYAVLRDASPGLDGKRANTFMIRLQDPERTAPSVETPITRRIRDLPFSSVLAKRPLTRGQAEALFAEFSSRVGVKVELNWDSESQGVWVDPQVGKSIEIPGRLVRQAGVYEDTLAVIVAHELSHLEGHHKDEARADYEATRIGLRRLWDPNQDEDVFFERAMLAAYSLMLHLSSSKCAEPLQLRSAEDAEIEMHLGGYPTLQSRWDLMKAGILEAPMPRIKNSC